MLRLRPMLPEEFPAYCDYFIADYSEELVENYGHPKALAIELAKSDLQRYFPAGPVSQDHSLLCLDAEIAGQICRVGYLWHTIHGPDHSTFIYDLYVAEAYRSQGFGKQAMVALEQQLQPLGIQQIKLRVAYHNQRACKLYQELGFAITGFNMAKNMTHSVSD